MLQLAFLSLHKSLPVCICAHIWDVYIPMSMKVKIWFSYVKIINIAHNVTSLLLTTETDSVLETIFILLYTKVFWGTYSSCIAFLLDSNNIYDILHSIMNALIFENVYVSLVHILQHKVALCINFCSMCLNSTLHRISIYRSIITNYRYC